MAKQKVVIKNMKLEHNELSPTTIGVFENRKKSSIGIFFLLGLFIAVVVFLPDISDWLDGYLNPQIATPGNTPKPNKPVVPGNEVNYGNTFYPFTNELKIDRDKIVVDNFSVDVANNSLSFRVTNKTNTYLKVESLNYFLELYTKEQTLLERVKLIGDKALTGGNAQNYTMNIKVETAANLGTLVLVQKEVSDYPPVTLQQAENGSAAMVCYSNHEKVTYKFTEDKLKEVTSEASYMKTDPDYSKYLQDNKVLSNTYNSKTGIVSTIFEYSEGCNITTNVNLSEADRLYVFNADSFQLDTEPKIVKFEMEAQGFTCK